MVRFSFTTAESATSTSARTGNGAGRQQQCRTTTRAWTRPPAPSRTPSRESKRSRPSV